MVPIQTVFFILVFLFGLVGSLRGWAKEIVVAFSVVLALFVEHVFLTYLTPVRELFQGLAPESQFYARTLVFAIIVLFGYAGPTLVRIGTGKTATKERLQNILLGLFIGLINGFLIIGTVLSYLHTAHYGIEPEYWIVEQKTAEDGQPVVDVNGSPVLVVVGYMPEGEGIGGIEPPASDSSAVALISWLPPEVLKTWDALLYIAVAVSFIFVLVAFI